MKKSDFSSDPVSLVLTPEELIARSRDVSAFKNLPAWQRNLFSFVNQWNDSSSEISVRTSGSTGKPRKIIVSKERMRHSARLTGQSLALKGGSTIFLCLPLEYIAGKMMVVRALVLGLKLVAVRPTARPVEGLNQPVALAAMVPYQLQNSLDHPSLGFIETLLVGGAPVSPELEERIWDLSVKVIETYGMTETLTHVAFRYLNGPETSRVFRALEGISFDQTSTGCLIVKAPTLVPDPVVTRDLVTLESSQTFRWLGRADHVINTGGAKVIPERVERKLVSQIGSRPFFIAGIPDRKLGEKVVLVVEGEARLPEDYHIGEGLDRFEKPRDIFYLRQFIYTPSGKIDRRATLRTLEQQWTWKIPESRNSQ